MKKYSKRQLIKESKEVANVSYENCTWQEVYKDLAEQLSGEFQIVDDTQGMFDNDLN